MGERTGAHVNQEAWLGCSLTLIMGRHVSSLGLSSLVGKVEGELGVLGEVEVKLHLTSYPSIEADICSGLPVAAQRVLTKTTPETKNPMLLQQGGYLYVYYSFLPLKFATQYRNNCNKNDLYRVPPIILSHRGLVCINNCHFKKKIKPTATSLQKNERRNLLYDVLTQRGSPGESRNRPSENTGVHHSLSLICTFL